MSAARSPSPTRVRRRMGLDRGPWGNRLRVVAAAMVLLGEGFGASEGGKAAAFRIGVVDGATGRGVPLVEFRTVNGIRHWTDSNGLIAFSEPGLMGREVYFHIESDGYGVDADAFGNRGIRLRLEPGGLARVEIQRSDVAERLYRVTGQGIYRDSVILGAAVPLQQPVINGGVAGQDTVVAAVYRERIHWFWGDTERFSYPLGNFSAAGATSELPGRGGLPPSRGVDLEYFVGPDGFTAPMCPDFGPGLHWIESVFVLPDADGRERLMARVASQLGLEPAYAWHLAVWDDEHRQFTSRVRWDLRRGHDSAHPFVATADAIAYLFVYPDHRVQANWAAVTNLARYESFTFVDDTGGVDRHADGSLRWQWRPGAPRLDLEARRRLVSTGILRGDEPGLRTLDAGSGASVELHRGSVFWNAWRRRWIRIASGKPGDIWYSEALSPVGPWKYARRIVSHRAYNLYNPTQHPFFDEDGGRVVYFEGTYTAAFSAAREKTPRYDYNQMLYRLDLSDERLRIPEPGGSPLDPVPIQAMEP
ncbi:MAG: hypothetical protein KF791_08620 [Verrucomicrobiae bacterium]|nr:hypothetical protein [Verrucomicrobiae bacterium]